MSFDQRISLLNADINAQKKKVEELIGERIKQSLPGCTSVIRRGMGHFFGTFLEDKRRGADVMQYLCLSFDSFKETEVSIRVEILRWSSTDVKRVLFFFTIEDKTRTFEFPCNWLFHNSTPEEMNGVRDEIQQTMERARKELGEHGTFVRDIHILLWNNRKVLGIR